MSARWGRSHNDGAANEQGIIIIIITICISTHSFLLSRKQISCLLRRGMYFNGFRWDLFLTAQTWEVIRFDCLWWVMSCCRCFCLRSRCVSPVVLHLAHSQCLPYFFILFMMSFWRVSFARFPHPHSDVGVFRYAYSAGNNCKLIWIAQWFNIAIGLSVTCTAPLKNSMLVEVGAWRTLVCRHMNIRYKALLVEIDTFMTAQMTMLARPINDLEDIRQAMMSLEAIRTKQIDIDMSIGPIEVAIWLSSTDPCVATDNLAPTFFRSFATNCQFAWISLLAATASRTFTFTKKW